MNLVERNIQGQTPALGETPVASTLPGSQVLSAPNAPSLAPPMNLPTLPRSQLLSAPNAPSFAPPMNLLEQNTQGQTPALRQTPVAPTLPRSQPSLAPPMNLVEPDSTTSDIQYFRHFNGRATTRNLPRPSPYSREQDHPRRSTNQTRTVGALWNPL